MSTIKHVIITLTIDQVADNECRFNFACTSPKKDELEQAIRIGEKRISPMMTQVVGEVLTAIRQFENRLSEFGRVQDSE